MAIDSVNLTTVQDSNKPQNLDSGTRIKAPARENQMNRAGQTSDAGPAVVANFSAAALETSRAAAETTQTADDNRMKSSTERPQAPPQPPPKNSRPPIDLMV